MMSSLYAAEDGTQVGCRSGAPFPGIVGVSSRENPDPIMKFVTALAGIRWGW